MHTHARARRGRRTPRRRIVSFPYHRARLLRRRRPPDSGRRRRRKRVRAGAAISRGSRLMRRARASAPGVPSAAAIYPSRRRADRTAETRSNVYPPIIRARPVDFARAPVRFPTPDVPPRDFTPAHSISPPSRFLAFYSDCKTYLVRFRVSTVSDDFSLVRRENRPPTPRTVRRPRHCRLLTNCSPPLLG